MISHVGEVWEVITEDDHAILLVLREENGWCFVLDLMESQASDRWPASLLEDMGEPPDVSVKRLA